MPPTSEKALIKFLSGKTFKGIGKSTAKRLVGNLGVKVIDAITNDVERVGQIVGTKKAEILHDGIMANKVIADIYEFIGDYSIPVTYIKAIAREYQENSIPAIKENPYILVNVQNVGFGTCDRIANSTKSEAFSNSERYKAAIQFTLLSAVEGLKKLYLESDELLKRVSDMLVKSSKALSLDYQFDDKLYWTAINELLANKTLVQVDGHFALKKIDDVEYWIAKDTVDVLTKLSIDSWTSRKYDEYIRTAKFDYPLSLDQRLAIRTFTRNRVSIITGCPGTGKTTVIKGIIDAYRHCEDGDIRLLTPTGKAARRVTEATGCEAKTIHSALGIYSDEPFTKSLLIANSLVVVDEMSMVDTFLMNKLMKNIDITCHVVFVGDVDQLPSVSAGNVLKDLITSGVIPVTYLKDNFRQQNDGRTIINNAMKVNNGSDELEFDETFSFIEADKEDDVVEKVVDAYIDQVKKYGINNVAVLSPLRQTFEGRYLATSEGFNPVLKDILTKNFDLKHDLSDQGYPFDIGDRVMQTKNCEGSANGDIGTVIDYDNGKYEIEWESHPDVHEYVDDEDIKRIVLAYSYSIHKSQGSEVDSVIIPLSHHQRYCPIFKRNLIYTAITRAKKHVILVGSKEILSIAAHNEGVEERNTTLQRKLKDIYFRKLKKQG